MIRTVYTPNSGTVVFPIPEKYIGTALEISIFPIAEIYTENKIKKLSMSADASFGAWRDMEKSDTEICTDIRNSRNFGKREVAL